MIVGYEIHKINLPLGRTVGDNNCHYNHFHVCVLKLIDKNGTEAWGYGEKVADGHFSKPVSWNGEMPSITEIYEEFKSVYWNLISSAQSVDEVMASDIIKGDYYLKNALRFCLWDMKAKQLDIPLYKLFSQNNNRDHLRAYTSGLGFPQSKDWLLDFYGEKINQGFKTIKIKVGHPDPEWDLNRLMAIREAFGQEVEISIDANVAWDAKMTLKRIDYFQNRGVNLSYVEDPILPSDLDGYRILAKELSIPIAGHDYIPDPDRLRPLLDTGAITYLRIRDGLEYGLKASDLAEEYDLSLILCNTFMEWGLHIGLGNPRVERMEFADLGWNQLAKNPYRVENGKLYVNTTPGHGLEPKRELLEKWKV